MPSLSTDTCQLYRVEPLLPSPRAWPQSLAQWVLNKYKLDSSPGQRYGGETPPSPQGDVRPLVPGSDKVGLDPRASDKCQVT